MNRKHPTIAIASILSTVIVLLSGQCALSKPIVIRVSVTRLNNTLAITVPRSHTTSGSYTLPIIETDESIDPITLAFDHRQLHRRQQENDIESLGRHNIDKRFWPSRVARRKQKERRDVMVNLLLEELASLEMEPPLRRSGGYQNGIHSKVGYIGDMALPSDLEASSGSVKINGSEGRNDEDIGDNGSASRSVSAPSGGGSSGGVLNNPPKRKSADRIIPCFFNAITCF